MNIFYEIPDKPGLFKKPFLTIGTFDGVHSGHRKILDTLLNLAKERGGDPVVITFNAHPRKVLYPNTPPRILTTEREKISALAACGAHNIIMLEFTREMANLSADDFLNRMIINKIGLDHLIVGYDHAFGKDRSGDFEYLEKISKSKGFDITRVEPMNFHSAPVSSTWIRTEIEDGNLSLANGLLGRRYTLFGRVVQGEGRGSQLGFPTANIIPEDPDKVIPKDGVYAVKIIIDNKIKKDGMLNIGTNPTFANTERTIEVNIFDFQENIYSKVIELDFFDRIRDEIKFDSPDILIKQIHKDKQSALEILQKNTGTACC